MNKQREALKIALKVLNTKQDFNYPEFHALQYQAFNMVYEALAEPEQEPVADSDLYAVWLNGFHSRKPLTDEAMRQCAKAMDAEPLSEGWKELIKFARAIERAHGIGD